MLKTRIRCRRSFIELTLFSFNPYLPMEGDLDLTTSTGLPTPSGNDNPLTTHKYHVSSDYEENVSQTKANEEEKLYNCIIGY